MQILICTLPRRYLNLYPSFYLKALQLRALNWHLVCEAEVTAARLQQQAHDVSVPVLAGAHQRRGALVVLQVHIRGAAKEQLHHGNTAVAHCEHERCLARLRRASEKWRELEWNDSGADGRGWKQIKVRVQSKSKAPGLK